jgi:glycerophosphoryl diester phosphodiesterase
VRIADMTYAEILEKGRFVENGKPGKLRIARLDQALRIVKTIPEFWLDFKDPERFRPWHADRALAAFRDAGIGLDRVMVATFNKKALKYVQQAHPQVRRVAHCSFEPDVDKEQEFRAILAFSREYGLFGLNMPVKKRQTDADDVAWFKSRGLWISLWYVQDEETAVDCGTANADAFVTDNVSTVRKAISGIKK